MAYCPPSTRSPMSFQLAIAIAEAYVRTDGTTHTIAADDHEPYATSDALARRVRKQRAGRLLDGREHNDFPEARA